MRALCIMAAAVVMGVAGAAIGQETRPVSAPMVGLLVKIEGNDLTACR